MAETSQFTPEETALQQHFLRAWEACRKEIATGPDKADVAAEAMMTVATVIFRTVNGAAMAAARLRLVASSLEEHLEPAPADTAACALAREQLRKAAQILSDSGVPDQAILDGLLGLSVDSATAYCGRDGVIEVFRAAIRAAQGSPHATDARH